MTIAMTPHRSLACYHQPERNAPRVDVELDAARSAERSRRKRGDRPTAGLSSVSVYACALVRDRMREVMLRA